MPWASLGVSEREAREGGVGFALLREDFCPEHCSLREQPSRMPKNFTSLLLGFVVTWMLAFTALLFQAGVFLEPVKYPRTQHPNFGSVGGGGGEGGHVDGSNEDDEGDGGDEGDDGDEGERRDEGGGREGGGGGASRGREGGEGGDDEGEDEGEDEGVEESEGETRPGSDVMLTTAEPSRFRFECVASFPSQAASGIAAFEDAAGLTYVAVANYYGRSELFAFDAGSGAMRRVQHFLTTQAHDWEAVRLPDGSTQLLLSEYGGDTSVVYQVCVA